VTVIADEPRQLFLQTIFYSYSYAKKDMFTKNVLTDLIDHKYNFGKVEFSSDCSDENQDSLNIVQVSKSKCLKQKSKYAIIENHYGGSLYLLNSNTMCNNNSTDSWRRFYYMSDYSIEKMSIPEFCNRWIFSVTL
jgi:hypothetical protein